MKKINLFICRLNLRWQTDVRYADTRYYDRDVRNKFDGNGRVHKIIKYSKL
jgi:hypothetical protein